MTRPDVLIFQHAEHEAPGYFSEFLRAHQLEFAIVRADRGDPIPDSATSASGLCFMGGPMSVNDPLPFIADELRLIERAVEAGVPVIGHCLGGQLIARALGGSVAKNRVPEIGWLPVWQAGRSELARWWLDGTPSQFLAFHWHGETFTLPSEGELLWSSESCANQAFAIGERVLGMQCHIEMTAPMIRAWTELGADELCSAEPTVQSRHELLTAIDARVEALTSVARTLYRRWCAAL
jgi:GMP synthase-like glutamine amidotransferase